MGTVSMYSLFWIRNLQNPTYQQDFLDDVLNFLIINMTLQALSPPFFTLCCSSQVVAGEGFILPSDEIWLCDLESGTW